MSFTNETILKSVPALVALGSGLITTLYFLGNKFIKIKTTDQIDRLFLDKTTKENLNLWHFLIGLIYFLCLYIGFALYFNYNFHEFFDSKHPNYLSNTANWSSTLFFISSILLLLFLALANKLKKFKVFIILSALLILFNILNSIVVYCFIFHETVFRNTNFNTILLIGTFPLTLIFIYNHFINKLNNQEQPSYLISLVNENRLKTEKLIHGYVIDEKRTICFINGKSHDEVFYVCDFASNVYLKYTDISHKNQIIDSVNTQNNRKRKIYRNRKK
ncbi:hypothetical protein IAI44_04170 [Bacillus cereus]|uniref:hypothetical protein n=1 Tax=Bacillus cereus TaxID=1396 RepID=UPI0035C73C16